MAVILECPDPDQGGEFVTYAWSISAEHFISLTTGLSTYGDCRLTLIGISQRNEVLSYRMRVAELGTRSTLRQETSPWSSWAGPSGGQFLEPAAFSKHFDMLDGMLVSR